MINVTPLEDSTPLIGNPEALRQRWNTDGALYLKGVNDPDLMKWAEQRYRKALSDEGLIDPSSEKPVWTGTAPQSRRPCDVLGTEVWHKIVAQPKLNDILHDVFDGKPMWIPIVAHRSGMPSGPLAENEDIFAGRHQDGYFNEAMEFAICWMPIRNVDMNSGTFAVAPGHHERGILHDSTRSNHAVPRDAVPDDAWRSANFEVGDVLIFHYMTPHTALPNPSDEIRMSIDVRAVPEYAAQPISGTVESVSGDDVTIQTDANEDVTVRVDDNTLIRDMHPWPRYSKDELGKIAFPGARVLAMRRSDGTTTVLRRNFY